MEHHHPFKFARSEVVVQLWPSTGEAGDSSAKPHLVSQ